MIVRSALGSQNESSRRARVPRAARDTPIATSEPNLEVVAYRIDFRAWVETLDAGDKAVLFLLLDGYETEEVAARLGLMPREVTEARVRLQQSWTEFNP